MQRKLGRVQRAVMVGALLGFCGLAFLAEAEAVAVAVFSYTGTDQTWTVPAGVTQISVKAWGAGGAGGNYFDNDFGGGGGFVTGTLNVTPGEQLTIMVGGGGQPGAGPGAYGGGGGKACGSSGRGGGRSAIRDSSAIELITAGAGGGGGGGSVTGSLARGGGGGGLTGTPSFWPGLTGDPGTQTAGGAGYGDGQPGGQFFGGDAGCLDNGYNGSGGSGYYGGGGGTDLGDGGGGGGSSLVPIGGNTVAANDDIPGNSSDPDYAENAGHGGPKGGAGNPGRVVILVLDQDGDGMPDSGDVCPHSDLSSTVIIDGCDPGVANTLFPTGCTISDLIMQCADGVNNHGEFVSCVAHLTNNLKRVGTITGQQKGAIQSCAAQANIP